MGLGRIRLSAFTTREGDQKNGQKVEERDQQQEDANQNAYEQTADFRRLLQRHRHRYGDNLGTYDLVELPAEAVLRSIRLDHRSRRSFHSSVTSKAIFTTDNWVRKVEYTAGFRFAFRD